MFNEEQNRQIIHWPTFNCTPENPLVHQLKLEEKHKNSITSICLPIVTFIWDIPMLVYLFILNDGNYIVVYVSNSEHEWMNGNMERTLVGIKLWTVAPTLHSNLTAWHTKCTFSHVLIFQGDKIKQIFFCTMKFCKNIQSHFTWDNFVSTTFTCRFNTCMYSIVSCYCYCHKPPLIYQYNLSFDQTHWTHITIAGRINW